MRCLALDIGGTKIAAAIIEQGIVHQRQQIATPQQNVATEMHLVLDAILHSYKGQFDAVAVASTGIIDKGILTALNPKNLGGLANFPLKESIARYTDKPIGLLNDVQAAVCAEYKEQNQSVIQNFLFITVSTGVGGGIILDGKLTTGPNGISGHIGHSLADPRGPVCGCGRIGCVEAIAAGRAIELVSSQWNPPLTPKQVFDLFHKNHEKATALVQRSASAIANLIADMVIQLNIQKTVIGGSVGLAEGYLSLVKQYLDSMPPIYHCSLETAKYGADAGLIGAAYWLEQSLNQFNKE